MSSKLLSKVKTAYRINFKHENWSVKFKVNNIRTKRITVFFLILFLFFLLFFRLTTKSNYSYIIISCCFHSLFSRWNLLFTSKLGINLFSLCRQTFATKLGDVTNLFLSSKLLSRVKIAHRINFKHQNGRVKVEIDNIWDKRILVFF